MKYRVKLNNNIVDNIVAFDLKRLTITYIDEKTHFPYIPTTIQCEEGEITLEQVNE